MHKFHTDVLTTKDITAVMSIAEQANLSHWSAKDLYSELRLTASIAFSLLDSSNACVGFVIGRIIPGLIRDVDAELYNIGVTAPLRRKGGGRMLMSRFLDECVLRGARNVWLDVRESNTPAIAFYRSFGFFEDGWRRGFYTGPPENAILMRLELENRPNAQRKNNA